MTETIDAFVIVDLKHLSHVTARIREHGGDIARETRGSRGYSALVVQGLADRKVLEVRGVEEVYTGSIDRQAISAYDSSFAQDVREWNRRFS